MSHLESIQREARLKHEIMCAEANGDFSAETLLAAAAKFTDLKRVPVIAGDPLLDGADAKLDLEAKVIWYNQSVGIELARYYQAHEFGHFWVHGERCTCKASDIDENVADADLPLGIQWIKGYSPQERREREANVFAREFLLPTNKLRHWFTMEDLNATEIAKRIGLPVEIVFHQLTHALLMSDGNEGEIDEGTNNTTDELDLSQQDAASVTQGPLLVEAGPGTGKTQTLVGRVLYLLEQNVGPNSILALTFSNRAAEEMRSRVAKVAPNAAPQIWMSTFHAFGLEILRKFGARLGLPARLSVLDPVDALLILERELPSLKLEYYQNLYQPTLYLGDILGAISRAKDELVSPEEYLRLAKHMYEVAKTPDDIESAKKAEEVAYVYDFYQKYLEQEQLLDFGDLIFRSVTLLREHDDLKKLIQQTYSYVLVDEYQDVNRASGLFLREIVGDGKGLWVVGDARQAIYRFRGAAPINIHLFPTDFPGAKIKPLQRNYRSQPPIVHLFATFAKHMQAAPSVSFTPWESHRSASDGKILMEIAEDRTAEMAGIAHEIQRQQSAGVRYRDQAVLCRSNSQLADIASSLEQAGVPVLALGDLFERNEIRDLLSLIALSSEDDGNGLVRVGQFEEYQISLSDVKQMLAFAETQENVFSDALVLANDVEAISPQGRKGIALLYRHLSDLRDSTIWRFLVKYLFECSGYLKTVNGDHSFIGQQKRFAVFQLIQLAYRYGEISKEKGREQRLAFLRYIRRLNLSGVDKQLRQLPSNSAQIDAVRLLTVHAAKGLEFAVVYLPFLGRGKFPASKKSQSCPPPPGMIATFGNDNHSEEEESLFFVALSRARDMLCLSRAVNYGRNSNASEFLTLISQHLPYPPDGAITWRSEMIAPNKQSRPIFTSTDSVFNERLLDLYTQCPRQYFYEAVLRLRGDRDDSAHVQFHRCVYDVVRWVRRERGKGHSISDANVQTYLADLWLKQGPSQHPYSAFYQNQAIELVSRAIRRISTWQSRDQQIEVEIPLTHGRVRFTPDYVELVEGSTQPSVVIQRLRTGRPTKSEMEKDIYALYQKAAEQAYPNVMRQIQVMYLSTDEIHDVKLPPKTVATRLEHYDNAIVGILKEEFPPSPDDRKCPRCPHYFICPVPEKI